MSHAKRAVPLRQRQRTISAYLPWVCVLGIIIIFFVLFVPHAAGQSGTAVLTSDFEDGTLQGWGPRGSAVLANTGDAANTGTRSLMVTGRTANWNGPSIDMTGKVAKGTLYQVTAFVRLLPGQAADTLKITMQRNLGPGGNCASFDQIVSSANNGVTDAAWVMLRGQYIFSSEATQLQLYVESDGATTQFYVDDVSVIEIPRDDTGLTSDFETGTTEGWFQRGDGTIAVATDAQHAGTYSLFSSGRTASWNGPALDVTAKMYNGSQYRVSMWIMLAAGEADRDMRVSLQRNSQGGQNFHTIVGNTRVTSTGWTQLAANFTVPAGGDQFFLYAESADGTPSFYIDDVQVAYIPPPVIQNLTPLYEPFLDKFTFGAALATTDIVGAKSDLVKRHFNSLTAENDMKWDATEPTENGFTFTNADRLVCYAQAFNMAVHGHTLVWHSQTPDWVFQRDGVDMSTQPPSEENKQLLFQRMENHIRTVMGRYKGVVKSWDVVNEMIDESQPDGFRRSKWFLIAGTEYISRALQIAREVDPDAKLYINDFNSTIPAKRDFLVALARELKESGVPIDGVGHQFHNNVDFPISDDPSSQQVVYDAINMVADLGLDNRVTEFDVNIYSGSNPTPYPDYASIPPELHLKVAYRYRDYFHIYRQLEDKISNVTLWGAADDHTWLTNSARANAPLPFDIRLQAKDAYWAIIDPLQLPGADLEVGMKALPPAVLSGKWIAYEIKVKNNGKDPAANVTLTDALPAGTTFVWMKPASGWTCTTPAVGSNGTVSCTAASMATGATARFFLTVATACGVANGAQIVNTATAAASTRDPNPLPNNTASATVNVFNPPPAIHGLSVDKPVLFPANGKMQLERLRYTITDNCQRDLEPAITVTSTQPQGATPDWQVIDEHHVLLRAEVSPHNRNGRTYTIRLDVSDAGGASTSSSVKVWVPAHK